MSETKERFSLKDALFNEPKVRQLALELLAAWPAFPVENFVQESISRFPELELKARIGWLSDCLVKFLPRGYPRAIDVILAALPPELDPERTDDDFGDFIHSPYAAFVAREGCSRAYLDLSLDALNQITRRFSAEGAIRPFLNGFIDETLEALQEWSTDPNYHVRRLCSEGTRPYLPWNERLTIPYTAPLPLLDRLYSDPTRYVTRSVANHLNDLSRIDPELVLGRLQKWRAEGRQSESEMGFITRHALRTLIKKGEPAAMRMIGLKHGAVVTLVAFTLSDPVAIDSSLELLVTLSCAFDVDVLVDYSIRFRNARGELSAPKVFHLKRTSIDADSQVTLRKRHRLRGGMTTRTLNPGEHEVALQVNGVKVATGTFALIPAPPTQNDA